MELIRLKYEEVIFLIVCIVVIVFVNGMNIFIVLSLESILKKLLVFFFWLLVFMLF